MKITDLNKGNAAAAEILGLHAACRLHPDGHQELLYIPTGSAMPVPFDLRQPADRDLAVQVLATEHGVYVRGIYGNRTRKNPIRFEAWTFVFYRYHSNTRGRYASYLEVVCAACRWALEQRPVSEEV